VRLVVVHEMVRLVEVVELVGVRLQRWLRRVIRRQSYTVHMEQMRRLGIL
jgi:hypothetical protein